MKEEKQNWNLEKTFRAKFITHDGIEKKDYFENVDPKEILDFIKDQRKQACQEMIEYMENVKMSTFEVDKLLREDCHPYLEAAKEYLKTLS